MRLRAHSNRHFHKCVMDVCHFENLFACRRVGIISRRSHYRGYHADRFRYRRNSWMPVRPAFRLLQTIAGGQTMAPRRQRCGRAR